MLHQWGSLYITYPYHPVVICFISEAHYISSAHIILSPYASSVRLIIYLLPILSCCHMLHQWGSLYIFCSYHPVAICFINEAHYISSAHIILLPYASSVRLIIYLLSILSCRHMLHQWGSLYIFCPYHPVPICFISEAHYISSARIILSPYASSVRLIIYLLPILSCRYMLHQWGSLYIFCPYYPVAMYFISEAHYISSAHILSPYASSVRLIIYIYASHVLNVCIFKMIGNSDNKLALAIARVKKKASAW